MKKKVVLFSVILLGLLSIGVIVKFLGPSIVSVFGGYTTHSFKQPALTISLPQGTQVTDKFQGKSEVLFSTYLKDPQLNLRGYIQLWELNNLQAFLATSRQSSTFNYTNYTMRPVQFQKYQGYLVEWTASFGRYYSISGKEFWLKKDTSNQVLRLSFFVDQSQFSQPIEQVVNTIVGSLKW